MKNVINSTKYEVTSLAKNHNKDLFDCGIEALDRYLKTQANQDIKKNVGATYVLTLPNSEQILGYFTLSSMGINAGDLPQNIIQKLPRYPVLPGILLGRLAVDKKSQGTGIGASLLISALKQCLQISIQIGCVAVVVDAKNETAVAFYKHYGFIELPDNSHRLFLPMNTIKQLDL